MMEYVWSTIDFLVMYLFALCFFKPRRRIGKRIDFIILIVVAVMASFINDYFANSDINLVVTIIFIVVVLGFFEGNWKRKLFVGSSFFAFIITIEGIVALSIGYFFHIEASEMPKLDSDITQFFQRFLTELRLILVLVLYFFSRRKKNAPERKVQKSFLIIPILSAVLIIYLHEAQIMRNSIDLIFSWIVTIIVIVINTGGSANQLIPMTAVSGGGTASVYAPDGWDIGKAESLHENGGVKAYLVAYP